MTKHKDTVDGFGTYPVVDGKIGLPEDAEFKVSGDSNSDNPSLILRIERENQALRKALSPFVNIYEKNKEEWKKLDNGGMYVVFNIEDLRTAHKVLHSVVSSFEDLFLQPSEICSKYSIQLCSSCEKMECGDNTSPMKKKISDAIDLLKRWIDNEYNPEDSHVFKDTCEFLEN